MKAAATCCARSCGARMRNARMIGVEEPFLYKMTGFVAELMQPAVSGDAGERAARGARGEGRRAPLRHDVPGGGEGVQRDDQGHLRARRFPGALSFKLYDTYGLALDEQEEMAREHGLALDREAFEARWSTSASARAPVGRARKRARWFRRTRSCWSGDARSSWATAKLEADVARDRADGG